MKIEPSTIDRMGISSNKKPLPVLRSETPASDTEKITLKPNFKKKIKTEKKLPEYLTEIALNG